jgi:hypothetical protein
MMMNRRTQTSNALNGIRTYDLNVQAMKAYASDRVASETGNYVAWGTLKPFYFTNRTK